MDASANSIGNVFGQVSKTSRLVHGYCDLIEIFYGEANLDAWWLVLSFFACCCGGTCVGRVTLTLEGHLFLTPHALSMAPVCVFVACGSKVGGVGARKFCGGAREYQAGQRAGRLTKSTALVPARETKEAPLYLPRR